MAQSPSEETLRRLAEFVRDLMARNNAAQFASEGARSGDPWPPRRDRKPDYRKILHGDGTKSPGWPDGPKPEQTRKYFSRPESADIVPLGSRPGFVIRYAKFPRNPLTDYPYPLAHQLGRGHNPVRRIVVLTKGDIERIRGEFKRLHLADINARLAEVIRGTHG